MKRSTVTPGFTFTLDKCRTKSAKGEIIGSGTDERRERDRMMNIFFGPAPPSTIRTRYNAGHLIGARLGGPGNLINLVPMFAIFNQNRAYKQMENWIEKCVVRPCSAKAEMSVDVHYSGGKIPPERDIPTDFDVTIQFKKRDGSLLGRPEPVHLVNHDDEPLRKRVSDKCPWED